jgi:hypothetical protein
MKRALIHLSLIALAGLCLSGCTIEATLRTRALQGAYETGRGQVGVDSLALAQQLLAAGVPDAKVLEVLTARGLEDAEARRVLAIAVLALPQGSK